MMSAGRTRTKLMHAAAIVSACMLSVEARAQDRVSLSGRVLSAGGQPLGDVEITVMEGDRSTKSSRNGAFELKKVPVGEHVVRLRRIGYAMRDTTIRVTGTDSLVVSMMPVAELDSVKIVGEQRDWGMEDFERNRRMGFGHFFTRADIAKFDAMKTSDVLEQAPGLVITRGTGGQVWIQGKGRSASIRGKGIQINQQDFNAGAQPSGCYATVYLDNARVYSQSVTTSGARELPGGKNYDEKAMPLFDINSLPPGSIEAIEFYSGAAQIPARYMGLNTQCGVMVIHTRRPDRKRPADSPGGGHGRVAG
jgi:hypothetical protein